MAEPAFRAWNQTKSDNSWMREGQEGFTFLFGIQRRNHLLCASGFWQEGGMVSSYAASTPAWLARPIHHRILATIRQLLEEIAMESCSRFSGTKTSVPSKRCSLDTTRPCSLWAATTICPYSLRRLF